MAKSAPGKVTSPLERGLYIQKVPLLQGLLVADSANEKQTDRKVTSLLVADSPHEKQAERKAAESSHAQHRDRKAASLLPADVLHEQQNDRKVADPPVAPPREQQTDGKSTGQPHEKQTDGSRQAAAVPQAKQSAEEPRRPRAAAPAAAEGGELRVVRQSSAATSVLDGAEQVEFSAAEAASDLPEVTPTSTATSCAPRRLLSNLPEGSFLRARRMKALAAREDGLAQTGMAESTVQPGDLAPEVVVKSASSPSSSPTRGPSSQRPAKPLHRPPDPPRGRDLGHEGCSQRSYTSDPPSDPRLQVEAARTHSESPARSWRVSGLEVDVSSDCVGSGSNEESPGLSPNCLVWVRSQSPKKAGESKALKRARVLVVDRAKAQCKIKPRDGPTQVVGLNTVQRFRLKTMFNPDANEINEIALA